MNTPTLHSCIAGIENLSKFSQRSQIPYRTLIRIKTSGEGYSVAPTTRLAIEAAIKRLKPKMREAVNGSAAA